MLQQVVKFIENNNGVMEPHLCEPLTEPEILSARSLLIKLAIFNSITLASTYLLAWFVVPPIIGYGILFAEISLFAVQFRREFPGYGDTEWLVYAPLFFVAFAGYEMYDGKPLNEALVFIGAAVGAAGLFMSKYLVWRMINQVDDEGARMVYKHSKEMPEISEYIQKVKASGRDWLTEVEASAIYALVEHADGLESEEVFSEKLFSDGEGK